MNTLNEFKRAKLVLSAAAAMCALLNSTAFGTLGVLDTAVNPANNHVYYLLNNSTWTDAESAATGLGGHLATVNNLAENNWIWNLWGVNRDLWIGLYDPVIGDGSGAQHTANFVWSSGDTSTYRNWRGGEPNNGNANEYWTYILAQGFSGGGQWNDYQNLATVLPQPNLYGVVEVVPEPSCGWLLAGGALIALCAKRMRYSDGK